MATKKSNAKSQDTKKLSQGLDALEERSRSRFASEKGPSFEWIFIDGDPSNYGSFNCKSLWECKSDEEFNRLCRGIRQYYINENGPLANVKNIGIIRSFIDKAIKKNDPTYIVRAYTADTDFCHRLNTDLSQLPTHWSGTKHERNIVSIMMFHPVFQNSSFTGEVYRGMAMSSEDLKQYVVDSIFMNKTILSTSKSRSCSESFAARHKTATNFGVVCKYLIRRTGTALGIEDLSEFSFEKEVLILPYAVFKVKSIRKSNGKIGPITEIHVEEEEDTVRWTTKKSYTSSQTHTSITKKIGRNKIDEDNVYAKMFKDSQEKGKIDQADLAKWKQNSFGIDPSTDTYAKIWNDAKRGKFSKNDLVKWKKESGLATKDNDYDDSDIESYDGENDPTIFTASNEQSYATSKTFSSTKPFDMKEFMKNFASNSDN